MKKLLIICGPTATGKTKLGITLAKKFNGEIISADSKQVYRGMDIGTGKDLPVSSKFYPEGIPRRRQVQSSKLQLSVQSFRIGYYDVSGVKIWLLDIVEPNYRFNVADYKKCADSVIEDIFKRGKMPVVVGGTGFYIKALVEGIGTIGVEPDWQLRGKLSNCQIDELRIMLKDLDPERSRRMNESDKKNPRRLIRAIEIAKWKCEVRSGKPFGSELRAELLDNEVGNEKQKSHLSHQHLASNFQRPTSILFIGLTAPNKILYERIDQRVEERVKKGVEEEIRGLLEKGYNWGNSALGTTLAYREWQGYFEGKMTTEEVIIKWKFDEHDYARRQMTWFRKDSKINWFDITKEGWQAEVENLVGTWYTHLTVICN